MKRLMVALLAAITSIAAWTMPAPEEAAGLVVELPAPATDAGSGVWFCPGVDAEVDPILMAGLVNPGLVTFSLPADGGTLDSYESRIQPGVGEWDLGDGLLFHPGPAIAEASASPSAAAVVYRGAAEVAADTCYLAAKEWYLNGASPGPGESVTLRLFNPLLEPARVSLEVVSEFGYEPLLDIETVNIGPRTWEDLSLSLLLGDREQIGVRVAVTEGVVIPGIRAVGPGGLAVWPGESPSPNWEFPLAQVAGTEGTISVWNPGSDSAEVSIELIGRQGPLGRFDLSLAPEREGRFRISDITPLEAAAVVRSSTAVVAAVRSEGGDGFAAAAGAPRAAERWLVPGHGVVAGLASFLFVLNSSDTPVQVEARSIGGYDPPTTELPARSLVRLDVPGRGADITASGPVSVAWLVAGSGDIGLALGTPVASETP